MTTHELIAPVKTCIRPAQDPPSQNFSMDQEDVHEAPPLLEELFVVDCSRKGIVRDLGSERVFIHH